MIPPGAMRPWALSPAVSRGLRALHRAALDTTPAPPLVFVVLLAGAFAPETIPADAWRTVEGHPVAVVGLEVARDIATGRSPSALRALDAAPPAGGCWCLALAADGSALTWSTPLTFTSSAPSNPPGGDA